VISDVTGDDPTAHRLGSLHGGPTTYADAIEILQRYGVTGACSIASHLQRGAKGRGSRDAEAGRRIARRVLRAA